MSLQSVFEFNDQMIDEKDDIGSFMLCSLVEGDNYDSILLSLSEVKNEIGCCVYSGVGMLSSYVNDGIIKMNANCESTSVLCYGSSVLDLLYHDNDSDFGSASLLGDIAFNDVPQKDRIYYISRMYGERLMHCILQSGKYSDEKKEEFCISDIKDNFFMKNYLDEAHSRVNQLLRLEVAYKSAALDLDVTAPFCVVLYDLISCMVLKRLKSEIKYTFMSVEELTEEHKVVFKTLVAEYLSSIYLDLVKLGDLAYILTMDYFDGGVEYSVTIKLMEMIKIYLSMIETGMFYYDYYERLSLFVSSTSLICGPILVDKNKELVLFPIFGFISGHITKEGFQFHDIYFEDKNKKHKSIVSGFKKRIYGVSKKLKDVIPFPEFMIGSSQFERTSVIMSLNDYSYSDYSINHYINSFNSSEGKKLSDPVLTLVLSRILKVLNGGHGEWAYLPIVLDNDVMLRFSKIAYGVDLLFGDNELFEVNLVAYHTCYFVKFAIK